MIDPDLVRVDLLRCKRLLYLQYPEGSQAQKDFLTASKLSELGYLSKLVPPDVADLVFEEYKKVIKYEITNILMGLTLGTSISIALYSFHIMYPNDFFWKFWWVGLIFGLGIVTKHILHMVDEWRKMKPFKKDYKELQKRINKLMKELKNIR